MARANKSIFLKNADLAIHEADRRLHPNARQELRANWREAREWLVEYQKLILETRGKMTERFRVRLNAWNKKGYGLQSVSFGPRDEDGHPLRPGIDRLGRQEYKDPTLGFPAPGMLDGDVNVGEVQFGFSDGRGESVTNIGTTDILIRKVRARTGKSFSSYKVLPSGCDLEAFGQDEAFRVVMETTHKPKRKLAKAVRAKIGGIYVCQFMRKICKKAV